MFLVLYDHSRAPLETMLPVLSLSSPPVPPLQHETSSLSKPSRAAAPWDHAQITERKQIHNLAEREPLYDQSRPICFQMPSHVVTFDPPVPPPKITKINSLCDVFKTPSLGAWDHAQMIKRNSYTIQPSVDPCTTNPDPTQALKRCFRFVSLDSPVPPPQHKLIGHHSAGPSTGPSVGASTRRVGWDGSEDPVMGPPLRPSPHSTQGQCWTQCWIQC